MKALVSPVELCNSGFRIAQVTPQEFSVAPPLFWVDCDDSVKADRHYYDPQTELVVSIPGPPALTRAELAAATLAKAREMRLPVLSILDGLQASALVTAATAPVGDPPVATPLAQVIEDLKQGLRDLPNTVDLSACTTREEMEAVVLAAYYALASSAPAQVQSAFNSLVV